MIPRIGQRGLPPPLKAAEAQPGVTVNNAAAEPANNGAHEKPPEAAF